ncbi:carbohydrate ABC transporter permease [Rhodophyticola sp. CCM32]|uniref:carbohydrate ABC transporter permease n=1 Tax=Rhodophyticola sp. CCM32 TaxID=2916397 RepID=UPI00107F60A6|nr:carbohydrate ABC transporter permease [Rhodophyticola sp. CCM32]QBY01266.1 carbohydrate ABC transporter permease [Rhodophyticola sp. CCM32]
MKLLRKPWNVIRILALVCLLVVWCYPFAWLISASLKGQLEIFQKGLDLIPDTLLWENYSRAWVSAHFSTYMLNTVLITAGTVLLVIVHTSLTGYVLGRFDFLGKRFVIGVLLVTMVVPVGVTIIPIVDLADSFGLLSTRWGIILALAGSGQAAAILLYAGFFNGVPKDLEESAELDGAGFFRIFFSIMLPLAGPITATVSVLTFLYAWNTFLIPLVFTFGAPDLRTLPVGMLAFVSNNETDWSGMAAAATISLLPVILFFFFVQRFFVEGIAGAVKQ